MRHLSHRPEWFLLLLTIWSCQSAPPKKNIYDFLPKTDLTPLVDPMIGTDGGGNAIPGASLPHGLVKLSPDTSNKAGDVAAYEYGASKITGFSHTHLEGPGGSDYGYGELLVAPARAVATDESQYASAFSHDAESAAPGYYSVELSDSHVHAELTATARCGFHRYTFEGGGTGDLLFDLSHSQGEFVSGSVDVLQPNLLRGKVTYQVDPALSLAVSAFEPNGTTGLRTLYFYAVTSQAFDAFGTWTSDAPIAGSTSATAQGGKLGAYVTFKDTSKPIELRLCLSSIDPAQAQQTYDEEAAGVSFEATRAQAKLAWNHLLDRVQVQGGSDDARRMFYTALYHSFLEPADATEDGRFWSGEDDQGRVETAKGWHYFVDDWCLWNTFRTVHPLQTLLEPEHASDMVRSLVNGYQTGGWISKCTWQATGYSRVMTANPFVPVIADAYVKGFRDYDVATTYAAVRHSEMEDEAAAVADGACGYFNQGTPAEYIAHGYVSHECDPGQSASMTLEYAYDDWAMARFAQALGKTADEKLFDARALNYRNVFNPAHGFMQGRHRDGSWVEPFDPTASEDFTEASSWIYTWFVPQDVAGLMSLMGGPDPFLTKLDQFFDGGHDDPSNEPSFSSPYLYLYAGLPSKTESRVRQILAKSYALAPDGLPGNDDSGAMSAWYVFGEIGLYPITPGDSTLLIGSPAFTKTTLYLEPNAYPGRTFTILAPDASPENAYVRSATLNGKPLSHPWIRHDDLIAGGTLALVMGPSPSAWGTAPQDAPPSLSRR